MPIKKNYSGKRKNKRVADKIKAEILEKFEGCSICEFFEDYDYDERDVSEYRPVGDIKDVLGIIDRYLKDE